MDHPKRKPANTNTLFCLIDGRPPSEQTDAQSSDSDADIESRHSRAEVEAETAEPETAEPNGFPARIWYLSDSFYINS